MEQGRGRLRNVRRDAVQKWTRQSQSDTSAGSPPADSQRKYDAPRDWPFICVACICDAASDNAGMGSPLAARADDDGRITGFAVRAGKDTLYYLEGNQVHVAAQLRRMQQDPGHPALTILALQIRKARRFDCWFSGYFNGDTGGTVRLDMCMRNWPRTDARLIDEVLRIGAASQSDESDVPTRGFSVLLDLVL